MVAIFLIFLFFVFIGYPIIIFFQNIGHKNYSEDFYDGYEENKENKSSVRKDNNQKYDKHQEAILSAYELEEWQKDLVRKGEYEPWDFDEDDIDESSYYYDDGGSSGCHKFSNNRKQSSSSLSFDRINK